MTDWRTVYLLSHYRYWKCNEESSTRNYFWQIFLLVIINGVNPNKSLIAQITQHYCNDMMSQNLITWIPSTILMSAESIWDNNFCVSQRLIIISNNISSLTFHQSLYHTLSSGHTVRELSFVANCFGLFLQQFLGKF